MCQKLTVWSQKHVELYGTFSVSRLLPQAAVSFSASHRPGDHFCLQYYLPINLNNYVYKRIKRFK